MEDIDIKQIEMTKYPDAVVFAVRYGYLYRKEAEENVDTGSHYHQSLSEASPFLNWLANLVLNGLAFDLIKSNAANLWKKLMQMKIEIPDEVNKVLIDEDELRQFVKYVDEFGEKKLMTTDKENKYIREEIIADYMGTKAEEIWARENRQLTHEEWLTFLREAAQFADDLLLSE